MKKRIFRTFCGLISILGLAVCLCAFSCGRSTTSDFYKVFKQNWRVELPENMSDAFRAKEDNWGHYGIRYAVFEADEEPTGFIEDFKTERNIEMEYEVYYLLIAANFRITYTQYIPKWDEAYCWKIIEKQHHDSELDRMVTDSCYMIYFYDAKKLEICQNFA